ncbi:MAG: hypothetical protein FWG26_04320 [Betaproteobacteria bacterium]|nr:hypothetical protein [Betaproteobacteria bacterium]
MRPDALTVKIRARAHWEAVDLGLALVQKYWRNLYAAWLVVILPVVFLELLLYLNRNGGGRYDLLLLWWLKPLYDRVILHVLSRAVFGETVDWRGTLRAIPGLLWHSGLFRALTWGRFTPRRSFKLPIWQLEGVTGQVRSKRLSALKGRGAIRLIFVCSIFEMILLFGMLGLLFMMLPPEFIPTHPDSILDFLTDNKASSWFEAIYGFCYLLAVSIIEPFYVAAGFMLYLNQRTELEGWDIELGFRTLAARLEAQQTQP